MRRLIDIMNSSIDVLMVISISHQDVVCHGSRVSVLKNIRYLVVGGGSEKRVMLEDAGCLRER